ncbi:GNAT family N-acetyltransferase [Collimonas pratensis]|uniref:Acetyltransferase domain protein n=1 Tax=Collimonas pratensis TaxID=279113 RepID=A0A127Q550_9BURK|nr:GNAT family protein [Collimonas pratensis]AMP05164.1 acetyltransferase domain protein [Collimonas pratensis]
MIEGSNINIRHAGKNDLATLIPLMNDLNARGEYLPSSLFAPSSIEKSIDATGGSSGDDERFLIVDKEDRILGRIWHFKAGPYFNAREIGYILFATDKRRTGITSEAVKLLTNYLFQSLMINRLEIKMNVLNIASEKVAIKCAYQKEGVARGATFVRGKHIDMNVYSLLRSEWEADTNYISNPSPPTTPS